MHIPQPTIELITASIDTVGNISSYFEESLFTVSKDMYLLVTSKLPEDSCFGEQGWCSSDSTRSHLSSLRFESEINLFPDGCFFEFSILIFSGPLEKKSKVDVRSEEVCSLEFYLIILYMYVNKAVIDSEPENLWELPKQN